jgi:fatty-acyl-CoA synthase
MREGQLYVCGRIKDLIIVQGRNFHPTDLEWQASQVEGVRRGNVVAFSLPDEGRERVIVAAEVRDPADPERLRGEVTARILSGLALRVDEVLLLAPGSLPKTSSGKLQRARTAELYAKGELGQGGSGRIGLIKQITASQWSYFKARFASKDAV